jgi:hypothetical protein
VTCRVCAFHRLAGCAAACPPGSEDASLPLPCMIAPVGRGRLTGRLTGGGSQLRSLPGATGTSAVVVDTGASCGGRPGALLVRIPPRSCCQPRGGATHGGNPMPSIRVRGLCRLWRLRARGACTRRDPHGLAVARPASSGVCSHWASLGRRSAGPRNRRGGRALTSTCEQCGEPAVSAAVSILNRVAVRRGQGRSRVRSPWPAAVRGCGRSRSCTSPGHPVGRQRSPIPAEYSKGRGLYWVRIRDGPRASSGSRRWSPPPTWVFLSRGSSWPRREEATRALMVVRRWPRLTCGFDPPRIRCESPASDATTVGVTFGGGTQARPGRGRAARGRRAAAAAA